MRGLTQCWLFVSLACLTLGAAAQTPLPQRPAPPANPDADAYRAFAAGDQAALARARSQGGDPARYAKENPEAIYDAMGEAREPQILEFVLKSGANPNAQRSPTLKGTPIFSGLTDGDKLALLVKYGADLNVRDYNGYAPLSHVLFSFAKEYKVPATARPNQKVRVFTKIEIVRLVLDGGADVNGDLGGWGRNGALGLAQREDKDVIALLVARGGTLKDLAPGPLAKDKTPTNRGPLTIALLLDRDDLALALLNRDKKVAANDNLALLEAARRGFADVAIAILKVGGDPNVTDAQGATPLGWAIRRKDSALTQALQNAGARMPAKPVKPKLNARNLDSFGLAAADNIDEVVLFDPDRFYLGWTEPKKEAAFLFYGTTVGQVETMKCEESASFNIVAQANIQGVIEIGVCRSEAKRVFNAANGAQARISQLINALSSSVSNPTQLKASGWEWHTTQLRGGWVSYTFPVLMVGHGIIGVDTAVLLNQSRDVAVIVQAELHQLCEPTSGIRTRLRTPLCDATPKALTDIAQATAQRL